MGGLPRYESDRPEALCCDHAPGRVHGHADRCEPGRASAPDRIVEERKRDAAGKDLHGAQEDARSDTLLAMQERHWRVQLEPAV